VPYLFFGIDKVLPHLHINFKISEGIKSPWQRTTLLVSLTLHNIPKDWLLEFFWWSRSWDSKLLLLGLLGNIGIEFSGRNCRVNAVAKNGNEQMEKFYVWAIFALVEPIAAVLGLCSYIFHTNFTYALAFAGAMIFVVEEVIPETQQDNNTDIATMGFVGDLLL
jgi:ZIP family zinc transporter